ncbi:hypothetical protein CYMTET_48645 [Cymbomonas tetramitiformis]|uniref:Uncharacterized protein n=1 Tax=Cymbomonas tetramitiformis TaxID=36881 RepID=A0AAE0EUR6_9CHLO|nr:hypothetical protein CYMTET_48645 [Cymbomonas tetramitiformis]
MASDRLENLSFQNSVTTESISGTGDSVSQQLAAEYWYNGGRLTQKTFDADNIMARSLRGPSSYQEILQ